MNRVVDTSFWIEGFLKGKAGSSLLSSFPRKEECLVPTIVQLELAKWLAREAPAGLASRIIAYTTECVVVDLDTVIALRAAEASAVFKLPTADAIIYATAREHGADLLTCDAHFEGLPGVTYIPKSNA